MLPVLAGIAVLDWVLDVILGWKANNAVRFISGCILGVIQIENQRYYSAGCFPVNLVVANLICFAVFFALFFANKVTGAGSPSGAGAGGVGSSDGRCR